jgi:hypothetical protein
VKRTGDLRWIAKCPAHLDKTPSLSVRADDDGRVLIHCFAGCATFDVLMAVGLDFGDLFDRCPFTSRKWLIYLDSVFPKSARARLAPRREPYWVQIGRGSYLGFRAGAAAANAANASSRKASQRIPAHVSAYSFRHTRISELLQLYGIKRHARQAERDREVRSGWSRITRASAVAHVLSEAMRRDGASAGARPTGNFRSESKIPCRSLSRTAHSAVPIQTTPGSYPGI